MASFAAYASQYLSKQNGVSTMSSSQPMFFSFTTDDGSRHGGNETDLEDIDDPHLRESGMTAQGIVHDDDEDPYLRLDEDEHFGTNGQRGQAVPLIARSPSPASPQGWLAHLARSPRRSPSPASSDSSPPADLLVASPAPPGQKRPNPNAPLPPPSREPHSLSLTDSLLPRDGLIRPLDVFFLPDPRHTPRRRRKYHDATWISLWLGFVTLCFFFCILLLFVTKRPKGIPSSMLPYTILLRTVPMLIILTFVSAAAAYVHVYLLRIFVKPVMVATSVFIPATLFISAIWAFVGSFMWDGDTEPTWGETVGLRLFSLIPLTLSLLTARRLLHLPRHIHTTSSTLTLTTHLLIANPFLLAASPAILLAMLIGSLPFVTLIFRLLLIGYTTVVGKSGLEWHVHAWANWGIVLVVSVWLWSWAVARGVLRTTCASVIGAWYFADPSAPPPSPTSTHIIHAAITRSTGPSLGSIVLSSLILTILRMLALLALLLQRLPPLLLRIPWVPLSVPVALYVVPGVRIAVVWLELKSGTLSKYALVYAGLTGAGFWESAKRGRVLVSGIEGPVVETEPVRGERRNVPRKRRFSSEPPLALLTISPLTLTFPFALMTYLFVAHTLGAPNEALGAAVLAGAVTALVGLFCVGLVKDTADTLYLCYCIDKASGERRREEVFVAFEYDAPRESQQRKNARQPETIVPRSPLFGVGDEDSDSEAAVAGGRKAAPSSVFRHQQRGITQSQFKTAPLSPYLPDSEGDSDERTPVAGPSSRAAAPPSPPTNKEEEEDEDMDPFKRSIVVDEEAVLEGAGTRRIVGFERGVQPSTSPGSLGHGFGHRRSASAGAPQQAQRMMTSTQELNMKSQFLMNMRYGAESQASEADSAVAGSQLGASAKSEGEESQLGPGSDFFK